jgi:hypothetical protein
MSEHAQYVVDTDISAQTTAVPHLIGTWLRLARVGWVVLAVAALAILVTSLPGYALRLSGEVSHASTQVRTTSTIVFSTLSGITSLVSALLSLGLSWMFFRRRFEETAAVALAFYLLFYAVVMAGPLEHWSTYWTGDSALAEGLQALLLATPTVALFLLFPNGHFVPGWTRWVLLLTVPWNASLFFLPGFDADSLLELTPVGLALLAAWYASFLSVGLYAQVYRYRRVASATERQQMKWVVYGFALWILFILISTGPYFYLSSLPPDTPVPWWAAATELGWFLALNIIPVSLTIAVTRYRLWQIDLVINRALLYGALPFEVVASLGRRLEGTLLLETVYPTIVETVAQALKLPYVGITVREGDQYETAESYGKPDGRLATYPLLYQGEMVGQLQMAQRAPNEEFTEADDRLLRSIAQQAGAAVHVVQLTADLQRSRQRLVTPPVRRNAVASAVICMTGSVPPWRLTCSRSDPFAPCSARIRPRPMASWWN